MSVSTTINMTSSIGGGLSISGTKKVTADALIAQSLSIPAAKLSTAWELDSAGTTGTATLSAGHNITTGQVVDIFWEGGRRLGVIVGTVAALVVPLTDSGVGDTLPADGTSIFIAPRISLDFRISGSALIALLLSTVSGGAFNFINEAGVSQFQKALGATSAYSWYEGCGRITPFRVTLLRTYLFPITP